MDWIPSDFLTTGTTALMRTRFNEAVAAYSLELAVQAAVQRRSQAPVLPLGAGDVPEPPEVEIMSHSSTEVIESAQEDQGDTNEREAGAVECEYFILSPQQTRLAWIAVRKISAEARPARTLRNYPKTRDRDPPLACSSYPLPFYDRQPPFRQTGCSRTTRAWLYHAQPQWYPPRLRLWSWPCSGLSNVHQCQRSGSSPYARDAGQPSDHGAYR